MRSSESDVLYATGLVRPKTTALFFDKLWIPEGFDNTEEAASMGINEIPSSIRLNIDNGHHQNKSSRYAKNRNLRNICDMTDFDMLCMLNKYESFETLCMSNKCLDTELFSKEVKRIGLRKSNIVSLGAIIDEQKKAEKPITSLFKNWGLKFYSQYIKAVYNINLVPIFFDKTEFENALVLLGEDKAIRIRNDLLREANLLGRSRQKKKTLADINDQCNNGVSPYEVTIKNVPMIVEESLSWKQVLEIRKDKKSLRKLRNFRAWVNSTLCEKSNREIEEQLNQMVEEYKAAIKKFGIKTCISGFTTVLSSIGSFLGAIGTNEYGIASAIIGIGVSMKEFIEGIIDIRQLHNRPIAYYYDILKK
ncbi:MAG: hypothetical protein J1E81_06140 [Eubacterium sp.]|nr:hypothetical protein [Eubacterium sp.]